jgi:hypothetical protein
MSFILINPSKLNRQASHAVFCSKERVGTNYNDPYTNNNSYNSYNNNVSGNYGTNNYNNFNNCNNSQTFTHSTILK